MFRNLPTFLVYVNPLHPTIYNASSDSIVQILDFDKGLHVGLRGGTLVNLLRACCHYGNEPIPQKTGPPD